MSCFGISRSMHCTRMNSISRLQSIEIVKLNMSITISKSRFLSLPEKEQNDEIRTLFEKCHTDQRDVIVSSMMKSQVL